MARLHGSVCLLALALACASGRRGGSGPSVTPLDAAECAGVPDTAAIAVTGEVSETTLRDLLASAPLGACTAVLPRRIAARDARDALDAGIPMLVTSDATALGYAEARGDVRSTALPWDRVYALVVTGPLLDALIAPDEALEMLRAELARDVVHGDARPARDSVCGAVDATGPSRAPRITFPAGDDVARSLAARILALAPHARSLRIAEHTADDTLAVASIVPFAVGDQALCTAAGVAVPLIETRARVLLRAEAP